MYNIWATTPTKLRRLFQSTQSFKQKQFKKSSSEPQWEWEGSERISYMYVQVKYSTYLKSYHPQQRYRWWTMSCTGGWTRWHWLLLHWNQIMALTEWMWINLISNALMCNAQESKYPPPPPLRQSKLFPCKGDNLPTIGRDSLLQSWSIQHPDATLSGMQTAELLMISLDQQQESPDWETVGINILYICSG